MSPALDVSELAVRHPVVSILHAKAGEPGRYNATSLQEFLEYELAHGTHQAIPYTLTNFYTDYINYSVIQYLRCNRSQYGSRHFRFNIHDILVRLARLAYLNATREIRITELMVLKVLPPVDISEHLEDKNTNDKEENQKEPDLEFRSFGILEKVEDSNRKIFYAFRELCVRDYLVALFLSSECHRKVVAGRSGYHVVSSAMRESMRKLPDTSDIWRIAFGLMSDDLRTKDSQKHVMKELIEECKTIDRLTPFDITNMCVEAIYESQNAGELTELLDDFSLNQTIRYSNEYLDPTYLPYAVCAVGYMVRASNNVYGVHMSHFGLCPKNIGMLVDPVNDVSDNNLEVLNLSNNPLGTSGMKGLLRFLVKATLLTHLDLGSCQLGNVGVALLSEFFMCMPLRYLRLSDNNLSDAGVKRMVKNLKYVSTLEWIDMNDNAITDKGAQKLGEALPFLPNLRSLDLRRNHIGDDGIESISANLAKLNQLTQLMLSENKIGQKGAKKLSASVWKTKSLRYVNLSLNNIPAEGIMGLRKAAQDHGNLRISVTSPPQSETDLNLSPSSQGEFILEPEMNDVVKLRPVSTASSVNLLEGRNADFDRGHTLRRSWSGRSSYRRSWHGMSNSFHRDT